MKKHCINHKNKDVVDLANSLGIHPAIAASKIAIWQEKNGLDKFPTNSDLIKQKEINYNLKATNILLSDKGKPETQLVEKLKPKMLSFIEGLNIKVDQSADELLNSLSFQTSPFAAFDTLQKFLALKSDITDQNVSLQTANIIYTFLGKKSKLSSELWHNVKQWSRYQEIYDKYENKNNEEQIEDIEYRQEGFDTFAHKQAIVYLIADILQNPSTPLNKRQNLDIDAQFFSNNNYKNKYEKNLIINLYNKIWNWVQENILNNKLFETKTEEQLKDIVLDIVDDVYKKDYTKFIRNIELKEGKLYSGGKELEVKDYNKTFESDPFAKEIVDSFFQNPFMGYKLSGSQVIRKYGKLLRPLQESLHDIDGVITLDHMQTEENYFQFKSWLQTKGLALQKTRNNKQFKKEITSFLEAQNWYKNLKNMYPSWQLENTFIGKDHKNAESVTVTGYVEHPTEKEIDPITNKERPKRYILDFFVRTDEGNYPEIFDNYWKDWKQIFEAKLNMGRSKDLSDLIYFDPFINDKFKFTNKGFRYFSFEETPNLSQDVKTPITAEIELTTDNNSEILLIKKDLNDLLDKNNKEELFNVTDTSDDKVIISNKLDSVVDNSAVNKVLFFNDAEIPSEMLVNDLIFNLLNTTEFILSPETKILFQKLLNLFDKSGAKVKIVSKEEFLKLDEKGKLDDALMMYDNAVNTIYMYEEAFTLFQPYTLLHGFIHEVAHSTTYEWYKRPRTQAQRDFKKFIDDNFQHYRQLALELNPNENELSHGFTNEVEFIAELYSNLKFQKEIQNIDEVNKVKKPFLQQLMEWFRQLLNRPLTKETVEFYNNLILIDTINKEVEMDKRGFKGSYQNNFTTNDFSFITKPKEEKHEYPKLDSIDKKLDYTLDQIKDNIQINLGKYDKIKKKLKGERKEKVEAYIDSLKELLASLNKYSEADRWKAIISYTKALSKNINTLQHRFSVEDFADKDVVGVINLYSNYLNSYSLIKEIVKLTSDLKSEKQTLVTEDELEEITSSLTYASGLYNTLSSDFKSVLRKALKERLSNVKYISEIETIWKKKLEKEYKDLKLTEPKEPWIAKQMNGVYKDEIQKDVELYVNNLIDSPAFDITSATAFFNSSINTNSKLITIFQTMLDEIRNNIIERTREKDFKLSSLFEKLVKEKGSSDVVTLYKNIIEYDGDMPILKGEYSIKYKIDKQKALDHFNEVKKTNESNSSIYQAAKIAVNKIQFKNYKNDFSKLSATEREVLEEFQSIINDSHKATFGISSLKKYYKGVNYLSLPSITKSDLERVVSGDVKGTIKDKVTDLTKIKTDDIGFDYAEKNIDLAGNPIYNIRVLYRGQIDGKNQSLDLFTMMRLEFINGVNYDEKHQKEMELAAIVEIAKDKDYYRTEGIRLPIINKYANRNKLSTKEGIDSNTYKRLLSLMESNIYNISHKYSGKLGPVDINKAIKVTNGLTAQISLALNPFSATANVINGKAQMFLEGISKNVIDFKNIKNAERIYNGDLGNNMRDLGSPIKKSFTNQVNIMFDSFGTISIGNQAFIKNNLAKTIADPHQLQFMHEAGEHWMQSTLTMAVLDSVKVMNENNDFINKEGNIVDSKEKAASLIDMLSLNSKTGKLEMSDKVIYTTHTLTTKYHEGGKEHINSLVKKKILDTMGNYDSNMQPEAMRHWWGKLFFMFRRYLIPMGIARFRGFAYSFKSNEELQQDSDKYLSYSHSLKDYEEGMYTSLVRYMKHGIYPAIKQLQFSLTQDYWDSLSDSQKGNIKKAITEMTLTAVLLPLLGFILGSMVGDSGDDDDKYLYFIMYQARRLESDLAQYRNLSENFKLIRSPIPSVRILETASTVLFKTIQPWTWDDEFESGKRKGDLKYVRDWEKLIPVLNKLDVTAEDLYKFQDSKFGMN